MTYWVEVRSAVRRTGPIRLVPLSDVNEHRGFRSTFAYDETVTQLIRDQNGTHHLRGQPVYADFIFLDFDSHVPHEFLAWLATSGLSNSIYDSGGRSVHVHIPIEPVFGVWVPFAVKQWTKQYAPTADISFLHPAGVYRLQGTFHAKHAGRSKQLTSEQEGSKVQLSPVQQAAFTSSYSDGSTRDEFFLMLTKVKGEGHRSGHLWHLATVAAECGIEFDEAMQHLLWWNGKWCRPSHDADKVRSQCESAYRRLSRRQA